MTNTTMINEREQKVIQGIDILLDLFKQAGQPLFPRNIATAYKNGSMCPIHSKEDIIDMCRLSRFEDCRLNAYPNVVDSDVMADVIPPTILFFDIDRKLFPNNKDFEAVVRATKDKIKEILNVEPTLILWTGGGIHFYQVIRTSPIIRLDVRVLRFCTDLKTESAKEFLRFTEQFFTNEKCDPNHRPTIKTCLLRIPHTLNSGYEIIERGERKDEEVVILTNNVNTDRGIATINENLVREFKYYLSDMKVKQILKQEEEDRKQKLFVLRYGTSHSKFSLRDNAKEHYSYVEKLISTPIGENRYFAIWTLIAPYYRKILGLSYEETEKKLLEWMNKCNEIQPVKNMKNKVYSSLYKAHEFNPWGINRIEEENARMQPQKNLNNIIGIIKS
jgi:hypothetical protein